MSLHSSTINLAATGTFESLRNYLVETRIDSGKISSPIGRSLPVLGPEAKPDLENLVKKLNIAFVNNGHDIRFQVDLGRGESTIQVLDRETGELIRQIPAEKIAIHIQTQGKLAIRLFDEIA